MEEVKRDNCALGYIPNEILEKHSDKFLELITDNYRCLYYSISCDKENVIVKVSKEERYYSKVEDDFEIFTLNPNENKVQLIAEIHDRGKRDSLREYLSNSPHLVSIDGIPVNSRHDSEVEHMLDNAFKEEKDGPAQEGQIREDYVQEPD